FLFSVHDPPATYTSTLSLHDALPIFGYRKFHHQLPIGKPMDLKSGPAPLHAVPLPPTLDRGAQTIRIGDHRHDARHRRVAVDLRSEEHTSELQSRENLVCRLLLEKNK